jgi:hypothetical protein
MGLARGANKQTDNWIEDGEKYALIGFEVKFEDDLPLTQLTPKHWAMADPRFSIPDHWRGWLGSLRTEELESANLFLISKMISKAPDVLDGENQVLMTRASNFYTGLLLSSAFAPSHRPVLLTGSRRDGEIGIRSQSDFDSPIPHATRYYPPLLKEEIERAARLAVALEAEGSNTSRSHWRFFRTLSLYTEARSIRDNLERLHQYCRCIEGLILPNPGNIKRQFRSRTELSIGPRHHALMGEMYDVRSAVEHLHEQRYLETFNREVRLASCGWRSRLNILPGPASPKLSKAKISLSTSRIQQHLPHSGRCQTRSAAGFGETPSTPRMLSRIMIRAIFLTANSADLKFLIYVCEGATESCRAFH